MEPVTGLFRNIVLVKNTGPVITIMTEMCIEKHHTSKKTKYWIPTVCIPAAKIGCTIKLNRLKNCCCVCSEPPNMLILLKLISYYYYYYYYYFLSLKFDVVHSHNVF
jgi:hypothetical protein